MKRSSGILLHLTSLPSPYGIGNLGKAARDFVDFLREAKQRYWQILPISPTGYGDSPYQAASTFAGNPYLLDPDAFVEEGLLTTEDLAQSWGCDPEQADFALLYETRLPLLRKAFRRDNPGPAFEAFCREEACWLDDYALFAAVKASFGDIAWPLWDEDIRLRQPDAVKRYRQELAEEIRFHQWLQFRFFAQWQDLRAYANKNGISIIGDIPIYVPLDSADVWSDPRGFQLDEHRCPIVVAGCPPDGFTEDGQYWGNPIYDWDQMEADGFSWWLRRVGAAARFFDVVRIDHFRGIESYWSIPAHHETARYGRWVKGPGMALIGAIRRAYPDVRFLAEDLGYQSPELRELLEQSGYPGMKVLEFAFDSREPSDYLPHVYNEHCVCYTGTHDNLTLRQWYEESSPNDLDRNYARKYMGISDGEDFCEAIIRLGMASKADLFMAQMQDYLNLGGESRMNEPGTLKSQNWRWRMLPGAASPELAKQIAARTETYGRA